MEVLKSGPASALGSGEEGVKVEGLFGKEDDVPSAG